MQQHLGIWGDSASLLKVVPHRVATRTNADYMLHVLGVIGASANIHTKNPNSSGLLNALIQCLHRRAHLHLTDEKVETQRIQVVY